MLGVVGKVLSFVGSVMAKVLHNRWVMLGVVMISFIFPPAFAIYKALSEFSSILQITGLLLQGRWKELAAPLVQAAIQWAINKAISFALEKLQNLVGGNLFGVRLTSLSACAKAVLQPFFPSINLDRIKIYKGLPRLWGRNRTNPNDQFVGFTFGNTHYYRDGFFNEGSLGGLALIAHELQHTLQFQVLGTYRLGLSYLFEGLTRGYNGISFEEQGQRVGERIFGQLKETYGTKNPCVGL